MTFVLRKFNGIFDACTMSGRGKPFAVAIGRASSLLSVAVAFCVALIAPLFTLGAVAALVLLVLHGHTHAAPFALAIGSTVDAKKVVEELSTEWEGFKAKHEQELAEQKKFGEAAAETKATVEKFNKRLDEIEIKAQRAQIAAGTRQIDEEAEEDKARHRWGTEVKSFFKYVRRGASRLTAEEVKAVTSLKVHDGEEWKALETDADVEGGAFVPHQLAARIIRKLILVSPFRALATVETISTSALEIPKEGATNFAAGWVGERVARTETTAASTALERIPAHEMYAMPKVSQTQLDDSAFDIESWISDRVATIMAQLEGLAFIKGIGVTQPEGVAGNVQIPSAQQLTLLNTTFSANTTGQGADKLLDMWATLPTFYAQMATWLLNRATLGVVRKFKDNNNQYLWAPGGFGMGLTGGFPATILGQPYAEMPDMDSVGVNKFPIQLGNYKAGYTIVDRLGIRVLRDNLTAKPFILLYTTRRVGGQLTLAEAVVQLKTT